MTDLDQSGNTQLYENQYFGESLGWKTLPAPEADRIAVIADMTFYVRTDGSNSNSGLVNSSVGAWLTLPWALQYIAQNYDGRGYKATIQVADGTYTQTIAYEVPPFVGFKAIEVQGNVANKALVHITGSHSDILFVWFSISCQVKFISVKVSCPLGSLFAPNAGAQLVLSDIYWGPYTGYAVWGASCSNTEMLDAHSLDSGANGDYWILASDNAFVSLEPSVVLTVVGTPAFAAAFTWCNRGAVVSMQSATIANGAAATGARRVLASGGIIDATSLTGAMPGSVDGFNIDSTGIYVKPDGTVTPGGI